MINGDYQSVEGIIAERLEEPIKALGRTAYNFTDYFIRSAYDITARYLRVPTTLRKVDEGQMWADNIPEGHKSFVNILSDRPTADRFIGKTFGAVAAVTGMVYGLFELGSEAINGNWTPAIITGAVVGATNAASLMFELGRKSQRRERISLEHEISIAA